MSRSIKQIGSQELMKTNRFGGRIVSVLASSAEDRGFDERSGLSKNIKIGICCFSDKHAAFRSRSKDWSARDRIMSSYGLLLSLAST